MLEEEKINALKKGLLELAVLKVISVKEVYVADLLAMLSSTEFSTQEGTLYPLLSKLRREGALKYEWVESEQGPPRKYYSLTPQGKETLHKLTQYFKKLNDTITKLGK